MRSRSSVGRKLKGLRRVRQDGKLYVYHRATGTGMAGADVSRCRYDADIRKPAASVKKRTTAKATPHAPWTDDDIKAYRKHWPIGSTQRLAFELLQRTGVRVSDLVRLGEGMIHRQGWLTFRQQKTGNDVSIPIRRTPPPFADAADLRHLTVAIAAITDRHMTYMTTAAVAARSQKSVSAWFAASARAAKIAKSAHGLRATRAVKLAESGATTRQIGAWTGHTSLSEIKHYSLSADRKRLLDVGNNCSESLILNKKA